MKSFFVYALLGAGIFLSCGSTAQTSIRTAADVKSDASVIKSNASVIKNDASAVKCDASVVKNDASLLKSGASIVKSDASVVKSDALAEAKAAIAQSNAIYFQAFARGDSSVFIDRYAKDCWIMAPNAQALCGEDAALDFWRIAYYEIGLRNGRFITTDVFGDGIEYVTEVGFWQSFDKDGKQFDNGKFLVLWKRTAQGWKMFRDSFSSDRGGKGQ